MLLTADYPELKTIYGYMKIYMCICKNVYIYIYMVYGSEYKCVYKNSRIWIKFYTFIKSRDIRDWLMWLWKLSSLDPEDLRVGENWSQLWSQWGWEREFFRTQPYILFRPWIGWMRPIYIGKINLLSLPFQILISSRNTFRAYPE